MKSIVTRMVSFILVIVVITSFTASSFADSYPYSCSWPYSCQYIEEDQIWYFNYGGYIVIPSDFYCSGTSLDGCKTEFYNYGIDMQIVVEETSWEGKQGEYTVLNESYDSYNREYPNAVYNVKTDNDFTLSGYIGSSIYYFQYTMDHGVLYSIAFYYPTKNRGTCDRIVERVTESFSTKGEYVPIDFHRKPSRADLDFICADVKYPNYDFMYLDHYITTYVTHRAVYCFKDPDNDIWRKGNVFTVYYGTEVTILAESQGYACVIINGTRQAGWINCSYLKDS